MKKPLPVFELMLAGLILTIFCTVASTIFSFRWHEAAHERMDLMDQQIGAHERAIRKLQSQNQNQH